MPTDLDKIDLLPVITGVSGPHCGGCDNRQAGIRMIPPDGKGYSGVMIVGDSGWDTELKEGRPFAGPSGQFLDKHIFRRLGVTRDAFTLANVTFCKAPRLNFYDYAGPEATAIIEHCRPYLDELIEKVKPKVIIPMGNVALRRICNVNGIQAHQCYVTDTPYGIPAVPTFHPSFIMQDNLKYVPCALFAFRKALEIAKSGSFERQPVDYCLDRPLPEMEQWMTDLGYTPDMPLAVDIETPETDKINEEDSDDPDKTSFTIIRCGFSFRSGTAASFPWVEPYISFTRNLLRNATSVVLHNGGFDRPRLEQAGCPILGKVVDTMWLFHFLQSDLPKSLEFVAPFYTDVAPWKHLSQAEPAFYNATDNDVTLRCYYAMREWLVRQGRWERFQRHCSDTAEILGEMSTAGVLIDVAARSALQDGLRSEIATLDAAIQAVVPRELLPMEWLKTDRAFSRAEAPQDRTEWEPIEVSCECKRMRKSTGRCLLCDNTKVVTHYRKLLPFNWNSTDQTQELAKYYKFTIPKKRGAPRDENGEQPDTLDAKVLKRFGKRKPIFLTILSARQHFKLVSTYDWALDETGRVHSTFGFWPSTWRKGSRQPNMQNIPKRNELAAAFRRTIIATPGYVLIEADSSAIEAVIVGYCAQSQRYIRAAKAGIHDIFMSHVRAYRDGGKGIDLNLPYDELVKACKAAKAYDASLPIKEQIRDTCKRVIHGTNYGLTGYGMHDDDPETFPTQKYADELQEMYFGVYTDIKPWMRRTRELTDRQTYLDNHYQYRHYFYAVTKWNSKYQRFDLGNDAKRCIAFLPQSDASAIQTEDLLTLAAHPDVRTMLRLVIHDSHVLEVPIGCIPDVCDLLYRTMSRPRSELGGLDIGVEIKVGENLCDTSTWEPTGRTA